MLVTAIRHFTRKAFLLGTEHPVLSELKASGILSECGNGRYRIRTREAPDSGETAEKGDFLLFDQKGSPYPVKREYFRNHYRPVREGPPDLYKTIPETIRAWTDREPVTEEIRWLLDQGKLEIQKDLFSCRYTACLWGTIETAPENAVILLYSIDRKHDGTIRDIDFNFIDAPEFRAKYQIDEP